jgi:hypothetical protein
MITVYIKGKDGYRNKAKDRIRKSSLVEGIHYITGENAMHNTLLYWITSKISLKEFKKVIGSDVIWKYRIRFYQNVEDLIEKKDNNQLSKKEKELIERFKHKGSTLYQHVDEELEEYNAAEKLLVEEIKSDKIGYEDVIKKLPELWKLIPTHISLNPVLLLNLIKEKYKQ